MNVKDFARPFEWLGATLYYRPFGGLQVELAIRALNEIDPEMEYFNPKTKERVVGDEPESLVEAREIAKELDVPFETDWQARRLWTVMHEAFYRYLPSLLAVEFPAFDDNTPSELRTFAAYWNDPGRTVAERWANLQLVLGTETFKALRAGYDATRDNVAPAKPELGQGEPKEEKKRKVAARKG